MRKNLILISIVLSRLILNSQSNNPYTLKLSQTINEEGTYNGESSTTYMLDQGQFINVKLSNKNLITKLNENLVKVCSQSLDNKIKSDKGKFEIIGSTLIGSEPHMIGWMEDDDMATYGAFKITSNCALDLKGKYTEPINIKDKSVKMKMKVYDGPTFMDSKKPHFYISRSKNKKYTMIVCTRGNITIDEQKLLITVLDENFSKVFYAEKVVPINYEHFYFESLLVNDIGTPFILVKKQVKSLKSRLLLVGKDNTITQTDFEKGENIDDANLFNIKENIVKAVCLKTVNKKTESISILNLSETGDISEKVTVNQTDLKDKSFLENKDKLNYRSIELFPNSIGEIYICIEHYDYFSETSMGTNMATGSSGLSSSPPRRVGGDVLILNINQQSNKLNWSDGISKFQDFGSSSKGNYSGSYFFVIDNNLGALYNDNESNHDEKNTKYERGITTLLKSCLALKTLSSSGTKLYKVIGSKDMVSNLKPLSFSNIDNNKILIYGNEIVVLGKTTNKSNYGLLKFNGIESNNNLASTPSKNSIIKDQPKSSTTSSNEISSSSSTKPAQTISNSSAIANGQANTNSPAVARVLKYKADEKSVEYYNQLREKFAAEEKIRLEKEAADKIINAKKEEEARQARHLTDEQAPQFDKYRNGATNPVEKKTTVEEDYNKLFK